MYLIYSFLYTIVIIVLFLPEYFKRPGDIRQKWLREKMGYLPEMSSSIWVHAVSVGEVGASMPLLRRLRTEYPGFPIILSTITDTGQKVAHDNAPEGTEVVYLPFDIRFILERCFSRVRPKIFITIETELWPNIFKVMDDKDVPVIVLNGRLSEKSARGYKRISFFMKRILSCVKIFGMQSQIDADRLISIGAEENRISVPGNFKFDMRVPGGIPSWAENIQGPVLVAGSTHSGEEAIILSAYRENHKRFPELKLIIAPRHPERFKDVEEILKVSGIAFVKRSAIQNQKGGIEDFKSGIILLDSVGELSGVYGIADIAIIGKSFIGFGGQNPLEPAYWSKPVVCGPHMENFPFIQEFYKEGAAFEVDASSLGKKIREILNSPEKAKTSGEKAKSLCAKNAGAAERALKILREFIG